MASASATSTWASSAEAGKTTGKDGTAQKPNAATANHLRVCIIAATITATGQPEQQQPLHICVIGPKWRPSTYR